MATLRRPIFGFLSVAAVCLGIELASASASTPESFAPVPNPKAEVREFGDGVRVLIDPGSSVSDAGTLTLPSGTGAGGRIRALSFTLESGRIDVVVPTGLVGKRAVLVRAARHVTAIIQRGHAAIVATPKHVAAAAYAGEMTVSAGSRWYTVPAGKRWIMAADTPQGRLLPLLDAPTASLPATIHVATQGAGRPLPVTLRSTVPASRYQVTLRNADHPQDGAQRFESDTPTVELDGLVPGTYVLEARAVDPFGLEGQPAPPTPLRVIGMELPDGAYLRRGIPQLGERQQLRLTNAEGLEMTYGNADYFVPVPTAIRLNRGRAVLVRLRQPGQPGEASFEVEPRRIESSIVIGPSNAIWPKDKVRIRVELREPDREGGNFDSLGVTLTTTLNTKRLKLDWSCAGNACSSKVATPNSVGPWVLRVELRDGQGVTLDHAFLEIADASKPKTAAARP